MQKISNYIRNAKGIGALWIFLLAMFVALSSAHRARLFLPRAVPYVQNFADTFFPIKIQNGRIVAPENTIISKTYHVNKEPLVITLDTTRDLLDVQNPKTGLYFTRLYMYSIIDDKIQRQPYTADIELKKQNYMPLLNNLIRFIVRLILFVGPFFDFACFMVAIVFYAFLTGFSCFLNKAVLTFKQKMRLNSVLFIGVYVLSTLFYCVGIYVSTLSFFLMMVALQLIFVKKVSTSVD